MTACNPSLNNVTQFGYSLFAQGVSTFAPLGNVPVGDDYVIGPGDELEIMMWGRINQTFALVVDRDGSVKVYEVGPVRVGGLNFGQAKRLLETQLGKIEGVSASVTMGQLRTIQVFVVGQVNQPGAYAVSSLSHITHGLESAGGVSKTGSLRHIELRRDNQLIDVLDLYALLQHGDASHDARLEPNDVIFVPVIGDVVAVAGDVKVPAIYELSRGPEIVKRVLDMAGGVSAFGYEQRVQVERVQDHQRMVALDVNLKELGARQFAVRDGDVVKVYPVLPERTNIVTLSGNVHRPGDYQWFAGMRVSDLLERGEGVLPHTFFKYGLIKRLTGPQRYIHYVPVNLAAALSDDKYNDPDDLALQQRDELVVFSLDQLRDRPHVTVVGEVRNPGDYPLTEQMRLSDLIYLAGGFKDDANQESVELARTQVANGNRTQHVYMDVDTRPILKGDSSRDLVLANNDQVFVKTAANWHMPWVVAVNGRVLKPGPYTIRPDERLSSVLERVGGFLPDAFPAGLMLVRRSVKALEQTRLDESRARLSQELAQYTLMMPMLNGQSGGGGTDTAAAGYAAMERLLAMASSEQADGRVVVHFTDLADFSRSPENLVLEDGDQMLIPKKPSSINVLGQVNNPTSIVATRSATVSEYLYKAGGPTKSGDVDNLFVIKANGTVITQEGLEHEPSHMRFPLMGLISGGIMTMHLEAGDTIYVPENLEDIPSYIRLQHTKDIVSIIAQSAQSLAILGLLATNL